MEQDFRLVQRMKRGEEEAVEAFVRKYYGDILKYCGWHLKDRGYAQDAAQETFERFFRYFQRYEHCGKAKNYLYVIAGNVCKDFREREKREEILMEELPEMGEEPAGQEEKLDMRNALDRLPEELRSVVILHYFQGMKLREISKIQGIGVSLVKYRLARGKELLRELLGDGEGR